MLASGRLHTCVRTSNGHCQAHHSCHPARKALHLLHTIPPRQHLSACRLLEQALRRRVAHAAGFRCHVVRRCALLPPSLEQPLPLCRVATSAGSRSGSCAEASSYAERSKSPAQQVRTGTHVLSKN